MTEKFPIRGVMDECADTWNNRVEPISPFFAAATFFAELRHRNLRYDTYLQTIITGGGHIHNTSLARNVAVERNIANGLSTGEMLNDEGIVDLNSSVEAAAMPFIDGWQPDEWMTFWPLIIGKPDLLNMSNDRILYLESQFKQKIQERINFHGLDMAKYRDRSIPKAERLGHYANHVNALHETLGIHNIQLNPVWRIIGLLGIDESVGSTTEKFYATNLGVRAFQAVLARVGPLSPDELSNQELGKDIAMLRSLGVQALAGAPQKQFILVEDREPINWNISEPVAGSVL